MRTEIDLNKSGIDDLNECELYRVTYSNSVWIAHKKKVPLFIVIIYLLECVIFSIAWKNNLTQICKDYFGNYIGNFFLNKY